MAVFSEDLNSLLAAVVMSCDEIGSYIQNTEFIVQKYEGGSALHGYNSSDPLAYLKGWCWTRSWDEYFSHIMDLWDEDRMSAMRFNALIERLSAPAARLDKLVPKLERQCARLPNMPGTVVKNAREMQTSVNSFLNSADQGLNLWKKSENILVESEIRQRRPISSQDLTHDESNPGIEPKSTKEQASSSASDKKTSRYWAHSILRTLTSNYALLGLTGIISMISCILQTRASLISAQQRKTPKGSISDPDFYNAVQSFLMQTLAVCAVLAPASHPNGPHYGFWTWLLAGLAVATGLTSLILYCFFASFTPLLGCVSSVMQAFVTLQLVFSVNDGITSRTQIEPRKGV